MPKVLTRLKIDEVGAVDRGAGAGVRIMLMKRASRPDATPADTLRAFPNPRSFKVLARMEAEAAIVKAMADDAPDDPIRAPVSDHHASKVADLLVETGKYPHRAAALDHLLHDKRGQALLGRMHKKEEPMDIQKELVSIMKDHGLHAFAKSVCNRGRAPCSEAEFTAAVTEFAKGEHPELSADAAFAKVFTDAGDQGVMLRKAHALAKETTWRDLQPMVISGGDWRDEADREQALKQLAEIGRRMAPTATPERQFALAFESEPALARHAHQRPQATSIFPFPR
jgi:hypothetical protein